uniref:50S ribosomal protein L31 n=1 Tax=Andalucia godoyi TaxID=505711 RepID=M4QCV7_ANDGO|nr:ribosomal protein L31 [Andalucia godoyi]AGH24030.1 ribosomal protein L31 [Andalucia godoyi]
MKKRIHPLRKEICVIHTDGSTYMMTSQLMKDQLKLDVDVKSHAIWNSGTKMGMQERRGQLAKFKKKYERT